MIAAALAQLTQSSGIVRAVVRPPEPRYRGQQCLGLQETAEPGQIGQSPLL